MLTSFLGELIGTAILLLLGNGVVANVILSKTKGNGSGWMAIATGWGLAVYVAVVCSEAVSGAHLNPAVTLGVAVAGEFAWVKVVPYLLAQFIGAFFGAVIAFALYKQHFDATDDQDAKLGAFCTGPAIRNNALNLACEIVATFILVFAVLMFAKANLETPDGEITGVIGFGAVGALPVALVVFAIGLSLGGPTGYAINPARDLSPRAAHSLLAIKEKRDSDWGYAWIPVVGPSIGGILAGIVYLILSA